MKTFLIILGMFFAMFALMAVGVMFKRKPIAGSCGGLANVGVEKACDCDKVCESASSDEQNGVNIYKNDTNK